MATVSELKEHARRFEEAGDLAAAVAIYQDLLRHFEECPDSLDDGPALYVRVGDMRLQLRQPARAFASYQQAAERYARLGSAEVIKELCVRMINVVPSAGDAYARYGRRLYEHGHMESALDVLAEYARYAARDTVTDAIDALAGWSRKETRPLMMDLLNTVDQDTAGHGLAAAGVSRELARLAETADGGPPDRTITRVAREGGPSATDAAPAEQSVPAPDLFGPVKRLAGNRPGSRPVAAAAGSRRPGGSDVVGGKNVGPAPAVVQHGAGSDFPWAYVGWAIGIAAAVGLGVAGVASIAGGRGSDAPPSPPSPPPPVAAIDARPAEAQPLVVAGQQPAATVARPALDPVTDPTPAASAVSATPALPAVADTTAGSSTGDSVFGNTADSGRVITQPIIVDGLAIQNVSQIDFRGQSGFRVVHMLDSTAVFVVESFPVDSSTMRTYPVGTVIVNVVPPDTTVSIVRFDERYLVFASGVVPEDSARALIGAFRIRRP